jgi:hypothetical protein
MAKQQHDPAREQYWRDLVSEWRASGVSVRAFCLQRQVKEASFYSWRREIASGDEPAASSSPAFVPVTVRPAMSTVEVRCPSGHVVTVTNADRDTLRHLFAALVAESPC